MKIVHGPIHLYSYCFGNDPKMALLSLVKNHPNSAAFLSALNFTAGLGLFFEERKILNKHHPDFKYDLQSIANHCTINHYHPSPVKFARQEIWNDFVINVTTLKALNPDGLQRFCRNICNIARCTEYEDVEKLPDYIRVPD